MARKIEYGDVISVDRGFYEHFGIYSGDSNVIHYVKLDDGFCSGEIEETSLEEFLDGDRDITVYDFEGDTYSPEETVQRARDAIGTGNYNVVLENCEQFANWCKTGVPESRQVEKWAERIINLAFFILRHK